MARSIAVLILLLPPLTALAQAPQPAAVASECDRLAASPYDALAMASGIEADSIDHASAIPACEAAVAADPARLRFAFQLGRAYAAAKREDDALRLYLQAAEKGYAPAMNNLGNSHREGRGVARDEAEAVRWYQGAADKGHAVAMTNLGSMYANGWGVPQDDAEAVRWYRQAAEMGDAFGIFSLALSYNSGQGVPKDAEEAARLVFLAVQQANGRILDGLKQLSGIMLSPASCEALERQLGNASVYSGPISGQCGPGVMQAIERLWERAGKPR